MLENLVSNKFKYKKLTEEEQKNRGILGRLVGVIADTKRPTRNGRKYSEQLWENVFEDPIMKEKIANRCCFGELNHPADRTEIDPEKVAICLAEQPKKGEDGRLYGVFDILSTPNGRILKALCDYGCNIGISSRGQGDLITDMNGEEAVDPDTYQCECFDAVLIPGVEEARLKYVTESLQQKTLKDTLVESLEAASEDEREIMKETLENLDIKIEEKAEETEAEEVEAVKEETLEAEAEKVEEAVEAIPEEAEVETVDDTEIKEEEVKEDSEVTEDDVETEPEVAEEAETEEVAAEEDVADEVEPEIEEDEPELSEEEIFLNFLATNFPADKIKDVCKILDIEVLDAEDDEDPEVEETEEVIDDGEIKDESTAEEEPSDEDINSDEEEPKQAEEKVEEAIDDGAEMLVTSLKEALKGKSDLENNVKSLQEKLAVSDAQVNDLTEECNRYKSAVARLSTLAKSNKDLKESNSALRESLDEKDEIIESQKSRISKLAEARKNDVKQSEEVTKLTESLSSSKQTYESEIKSLTEKLQTKETESLTKINELTESLNKTTSIKESYRKLANKAVNKYIEVKADILGLTTSDIKRKLGESYTMDDVDQVCEDLKSYQLNVSKLPFSIDRKVSIKVNEAANTQIKPKSDSKFEDDDIDDGLIRLANLG